MLDAYYKCETHYLSSIVNTANMTSWQLQVFDLSWPIRPAYSNIFNFISEFGYEGYADINKKRKYAYEAQGDVTQADYNIVALKIDVV